MDEDFDRNRPVFVKKGFYDRRTGNAFIADNTRPYNLLAIPEKFRNGEFLTQAKLVQKPAKPPDEKRIEPQAMAPPPEEKSNLIPINSVTVKDLEQVRGINNAIASKVAEEREKGRFTSLDDLDKRVPLTRGRKWATEFPYAIDFDA